MEFKGIENPYDRFKIKKGEIKRAKLGLTAVGNRKTNPKFGDDDKEIARLTVAGNIALANSLSQLENPGAAIQKTITKAQWTIETGLMALEQADASQKEVDAMLTEESENILEWENNMNRRKPAA